MLRRFPSLLCTLLGHSWETFGRPTTSRGRIVLMYRCGRCHRIGIEHLDDYPEILPAPPWSEAEARAALDLGTAVMDLPVLGPVQGGYPPPLDPLSDRVIGVDASLWFDPVADQWQWRSSTGAPVPAASSTSSRTPSRTWHH